MARVGPRAVKVLVVCTANRCRSPMAAALLARALQYLRTPAEVGSAGVAATDGIPCTDDAAAVMAARGIDLSSHRSTRLRACHLDWADLVIAMECRHVLAIGDLGAGALGRAFTLREVARLATAHPRRPGEPLDAWCARVAPQRAVAPPQRPDDDVADPVGLGRAAYEATVRDLSALVTTVAGLLCDPATELGPAPTG